MRLFAAAAGRAGGPCGAAAVPRVSVPAVSIVVVAFEMARELPRTVASLCPPVQGAVAGGCEIIVVDNGSRVPPSRDWFPAAADITVHAFATAAASPVRAVAFGLAQARGEVVGVWIDGARLASPGLVAAAAAVCRRWPRAVAATPNFHLGDAPQYRASGYDAAREDALLASIGWPADGRRLFGIAHPAALSGVDGPMLETNALFLAAPMWRELGGYDAAFVSAGGGAANPDAFRRALALPGAHLVKIAGEATFHQVHGGVTSNRTDAGETLKRLSREYFVLRGKPLAPVRGAAAIYDPALGELVAETPGAGRWTAGATVPPVAAAR